MTISPQYTLIAGILLSFILPAGGVQAKSKDIANWLLKGSVILLGASLNFQFILREGAQGGLITFISLVFVFAVGVFGARLFKLDQKQGLLITMGTAICGGSAIGALAPVIMADAFSITVAMTIVFVLNGVAVYLFPLLGKALLLPQEDFGLWAALAIHDTSSVLAASTLYGPLSASVAATVKLTRALWIIPVTLIFSLMWRGSKKKVSFPFFIVGFLAMSLAFTFIGEIGFLRQPLREASKLGFAATLFFIGLTFDGKKMTEVGLKPLLFGLLLWIFVSGASLLYVLNR